MFFNQFWYNLQRMRQGKKEADDNTDDGPSQYPGYERDLIKNISLAHGDDGPVALPEVDDIIDDAPRQVETSCSVYEWELIRNVTSAYDDEGPVAIPASSTDDTKIQYVMADLDSDDEKDTNDLESQQQQIVKNPSRIGNKYGFKYLKKDPRKAWWAWFFEGAYLFDKMIEFAQREAAVLASEQHFRDFLLANIDEEGVKYGKGDILQCAPDELLDNKDFMMQACSITGTAIQYASTDLRSDKDVVIMAASTSPQSLKYAMGGLNQDPDCLVAAKIWVPEYNSCEDSSEKLIVLSTRFSLAEESCVHATLFATMLTSHPFIQEGGFRVYSPNAYAKDTCDPEWTRMEWPCRGTYDTCQKEKQLKTGKPRPASCWRYSFRYQLEQAKRTGGFMIQVVDFGKNRKWCCNCETLRYELGKGQQIEVVMANQVGTKIFRSYQPETIYSFDSDSEKIRKENLERVIRKVKAWYKGNCRDMRLTSISAPILGLWTWKAKAYILLMLILAVFMLTVVLYLNQSVPNTP